MALSASAPLPLGSRLLLIITSNSCGAGIVLDVHQLPPLRKPGELLLSQPAWAISACATARARRCGAPSRVLARPYDGTAVAAARARVAGAVLPRACRRCISCGLRADALFVSWKYYLELLGGAQKPLHSLSRTPPTSTPPTPSLPPSLSTTTDSLSASQSSVGRA